MMMIKKKYVWWLTIHSKVGVFRALDALSYCAVLAILWVFSSHYLRVAFMIKLVVQEHSQKVGDKVLQRGQLLRGINIGVVFLLVCTSVILLILAM